MVGDWNVHLQDVIMWTLGCKAPVSVCAFGGHLLLEDDRDTPDTMQAVYEFAPSPLAPGGCVQTYTMRQASGKNCSVGGYGMVLHGTNGMMELNRKEWLLTADHENWEKPKSPFRYKDETGKDSPGFDRKRETADTDGHLAHVNNFLDCVVNRKAPNAVIDEHIGTVIACHLANVSLKLGRGFAGDDGLIGLSHTERKKHMDRLAGGHKIYWDAEKALCYKDARRTIEDKEANALLGREYRKGFELPDV
jgi:predicted dehydrogenase